MICILVENIQNVHFMMLRQKVCTVHILHDVYQLTSDNKLENLK